MASLWATLGKFGATLIFYHLVTLLMSMIIFKVSSPQQQQRQWHFCISAVWPDLAKCRHFGKIFTVLCNFLIVYWLSAKFWTYFCKFSILLGRQSFIDANGQMLKNNLAIWSHCLSEKESCESSSDTHLYKISKRESDDWERLFVRSFVRSAPTDSCKIEI